MSEDYVRGIIECEGSFTFHSKKIKYADGSEKVTRIPAFVLRMQEKDSELVEQSAKYLSSKNKIYTSNPQEIISASGEKYKRSKRAMLVVRDISSLKDKVVPFLYKKLAGFKGIQLNDWIEEIGSDSHVPESYKIIHRLYKGGFYNKFL